MKIATVATIQSLQLTLVLRFNLKIYPVVKPLCLQYRLSKLQYSSTVGETQISQCFTYEWSSNEVKILGHKRKVDLLPIRPVADLIIAHGCIGAF